MSGVLRMEGACPAGRRDSLGSNSKAYLADPRAVMSAQDVVTLKLSGNPAVMSFSSDVYVGSGRFTWQDSTPETPEVRAAGSPMDAKRGQGRRCRLQPSADGPNQAATERYPCSLAALVQHPSFY